MSLVVLALSGLDQATLPFRSTLFAVPGDFQSVTAISIS